MILLLAGLLHAEHVRDRRVCDRGSLGPSYGLHLGNARNSEDGLGQFVQHQEICRIAQIVIGLDHQDLGRHHCRLGKMSRCGRHPLIGRNIFREILLVVVAGFDIPAAPIVR